MYITTLMLPGLLEDPAGLVLASVLLLVVLWIVLLPFARRWQRQRLSKVLCQAEELAARQKETERTIKVYRRTIPETEVKLARLLSEESIGDKFDRGIRSAKWAAKTTVEVAIGMAGFAAMAAGGMGVVPGGKFANDAANHFGKEIATSGGGLLGGNVVQDTVESAKADLAHQKQCLAGLERSLTENQAEIETLELRALRIQGQNVKQTLAFCIMALAMAGFYAYGTISM